MKQKVLGTAPRLQHLGAASSLLPPHGAAPQPLALQHLHHPPEKQKVLVTALRGPIPWGLSRSPSTASMRPVLAPCIHMVPSISWMLASAQMVTISCASWGVCKQAGPQQPLSRGSSYGALLGLVCMGCGRASQCE